MIKKIILALLLISTCSATEITLKEISSKPKSRAKDFMIWQFLKQKNTTHKEADIAYALVNNTKNYKLRRAYIKKTKNKDIRYEIDCRKKENLLKIKDLKCLKLAFTPYKATKLTNEQRKELSTRFKSQSKKDLLAILNEDKNLDSYKKYSPDTILTLFGSTGQRYRAKHLNIYLNKEFIDYMKESWKISSFVKTIVFNDKFDKLQISLLDIDAENLSSKTCFLLGLNSLRHSDTKNAVRFFEFSRDYAKSKMDVDKNNFWLYEITKDKKYLNKLLLSMDINIYTLYQREKMSIEVDNYFVTLKTDSQNSKKSLTNPFHWDQIRKKIKAAKKEELFELAKDYKNIDMLPVQAMITQKAYNHNMHSYIMPYDKYLEGLNVDTKALVYSLMRQESRMIPAALSRSYALGLMQIMPFVTDDISKRINNPIKSYDDMFKPCYNIRYSRAHIRWMQKSLYHPLFMAYAYNGGLGFFKRYLLKGHFSDAKYEPFLSMEMMAQSETREYGKKVLANYVMYKKIMGDEVSIIHLFDTLKEPQKTDCFRK